MNLKTYVAILKTFSKPLKYNYINLNNKQKELKNIMQLIDDYLVFNKNITFKIKEEANKEIVKFFKQSKQFQHYLPRDKK